MGNNSHVLFGRRSIATFTAAALLGSALVALSPAAHASDDRDGTVSIAEVQHSLESLRDSSGDLLANPIGSKAQGDAAAVATTDSGISIEIPIEAADGVSLRNTDGSAFRIGLPQADNEAALLSDGSVVYTSENSTASTVIPTEAGVQMLTTITDQSAPTRFPYHVGLGPGQIIQLTDNGGAVIVNADGVSEMTVAPAWAEDAIGQSIPTHYEIEGEALVQVVEHTSTPGVAYPIVADPFWIPWIAARCLLGLGLNWAMIARIASLPAGGIQAAFGYAAARCLMGR